MIRKKQSFKRRTTIKHPVLRFYKNIPLSNHDLIKWYKYLNIPIKNVLSRNETVHHNYINCLFIIHINHICLEVTGFVLK